MFDTSKLRGRIVEKFGTQGAFAEAVNNSSVYVSEVLNGKRYLEQRTIEKWSNALDISAVDLPVYFFALRVHDTEQKET